jgi:hypothetical protein
MRKEYSEQTAELRYNRVALDALTAVIRHCIKVVLFLLLQWGETMSLWNWSPNGSFVHPTDDSWVNMEQRCNDTDRGKPKDSEKTPQSE